MGNRLKKMIKPIKSKTNKEIIDELLETNKKFNSNSFWESQYANRHVHKFKIPEIDPLIDPLDSILEKLLKKIGVMVSAQESINYMFLYKLIYTWHRLSINDGFRDIRFEQELDNFRGLLDLLTTSEANIIRKIHELSYEYGIFILELYRLPNQMGYLLKDLLNKKTRHEELLVKPRFSLPKKDDRLKGIEILIRNFDSNIKINCDIAIYVNDDDKVSHIKQQLKEIWNEPNQHIIGNKSDYEIAFFIVKKDCTPSNVLNIIKLQIDAFKQYRNGGITPIILCKDKALSKDMRKEIKTQKKIVSGLNEQLRISDNQINKHWNYEKGNIRRAVGLFLWDEMNSNNTSPIEEIDKLLDNQPKELFELYHTLYNKPCPENPLNNLSTLSSVRETVIRELYCDIELTKRCILDFKLYHPNDIKSMG
jgi:hypothetical protein